MGPNILSGLDRIRITQTRLFLKNFCIVVALIIKSVYYWMDQHTYSNSFQLIYVNQMLIFFNKQSLKQEEMLMFLHVY